MSANFPSVGAWFVANEERVPSKKALREALKADPGSVIFDATALSSLTPGQPRHYRADELPAGVTLVVVGPDPYESRKWYANVSRTARGVVVK